MGVGTLRRYHPTIDPELVPDAKADADPEVVEHQEAIDAARVAFDAARDAANEATKAANEAPDDIDLAADADAKATAAQEAQEHLEAVQTEFEDQKAREAVFADAPNRGASKAAWVDYAGSHGRDEASLVDDDGKPLGRDAIADIFLGPKA